MSGEVTFDPCSMCPRMPIQEAIDRGYVPDNIMESIKMAWGTDAPASKLGLFITSPEAMQDMEVHLRRVGSIRTKPITDQEIAEWHRADAMLNLEYETIDEKKARLESLGFKIERTEKPYEYFGEYDDPEFVKAATVQPQCRHAP